MPADCRQIRRESSCPNEVLGGLGACPDVQSGGEGCEARVGEQCLGQGVDDGSQEAGVHSAAADTVEAAREAVHQLSYRRSHVRIGQ
eukprot:6197684-Pleurochrysis_carterae.AAC.1